MKYYDPKLQLVLQIDASETGLGATFMQENQPIAYASRALTDTETKYAQIERELLSVILGLERFHQYTFGRTVLVRSDHKPLENSEETASCSTETITAYVATVAEI